MAAIVERPAIDLLQLSATVDEVLQRVKAEGDRAVLDYEEKFDHVRLENLAVSEEEMDDMLASDYTVGYMWGTTGFLYNVINAPVTESMLEKIILISKEFDCQVQNLSTEVIEDSNGKKVECSFQAVFTCAEPKVTEFVARLEKETNAYSVQLLGHKQ